MNRPMTDSPTCCSPTSSTGGAPKQTLPLNIQQFEVLMALSHAMKAAESSGLIERLRKKWVLAEVIEPFQNLVNRAMGAATQE